MTQQHLTNQEKEESATCRSRSLQDSESSASLKFSVDVFWKRSKGRANHNIASLGLLLCHGFSISHSRSEVSQQPKTIFSTAALHTAMLANILFLLNTQFFLSAYNNMNTDLYLLFILYYLFQKQPSSYLSACADECQMWASHS